MRMACSIPARRFRRCTVAPNTASSMCTWGRCRLRSCRDFDERAMMDMVLETLRDRIRAADAARTPLRLRGAGTKDFYGERLAGETLDTRVYRGIISYEPSELVVTVRCGTPLSEL